MRWVRKPPVHFVAIGVALFALERHRAPEQPAERPTVTITAARLAQLEGDLRRSADVPLDRDALLERAIEEEVLYREALARGRDDQSIQYRLSEKMRFLADEEKDEDGADRPTIDGDLYREALALGLDCEDPLVRGILVHKMRLLLKRTSGVPSPDDAELRAYLEQHRDRYLQPARVTFDHVFLARARGEGPIDAEAGRLLAQLRSRPNPLAGSVRLGDPFPLGSHLRAQSAQSLARTFGSEFAAAVFALEPETWSPVRSAYGIHLVRVARREPARMPELNAVRSRVRAQLMEERQQARLEDEIRALRAKYAVRLEPAPEVRG
jgi:hypothetical protein